MVPRHRIERARRVWAIAIAAWAAWSSCRAAEAQDVLWSSTQYGSVPARLGDIDGDGFADVVSSAETTVYVLSGASGTVLYQFTGGINESSGTGIGDFDGDRVPDILIGMPGGGSASVFSGATGSEILSKQGSSGFFGIQVASAGDVDGDGLGDFLVCEPDGIYFDKVRLYTSAGQSEIRYAPYQSEPGIGPTASGAGDLNGDGASEYLIGSGLTVPSDPFGPYPGYVTAYDGATGASLTTLNGESTGDWFGVALDGGQDVNGDGVSDFIVGAPYNDAGGDDGGRAYVYSGADSSLLYTWTGYGDALIGGDGLGTSVAFVGDVDRDGFADCAVCAPGAHAGNCVYVYSGKSGAVYFKIADTGLDAVSHVAGVGDVNGDGLPDIAVGDGSTSSSTGVVVVSGAIAPTVSSVTPNRARYTASADVTIAGSHFLLGTQTTVQFAGQIATNVLVVDDSTITCTAPAGEPGPVTVTLQNSIGAGSLDGGFTYSPAVLWDGDATLDGTIHVHYLCDPLDGMLAIIGTDPANIPTPPFDGALGIAPFEVVFVLPPRLWPFDHFDLSGNVPNDPSLIGVTVLLQALDGPSFAKPKDAAWTNCAAISIQ